MLLCSLHLPSPLPLVRSALSALLFGAPRPRLASCLVVISCVSLQLNSRCWPLLRTPSRSASLQGHGPRWFWSLRSSSLLAHPQLPQPPQRPRWRPRPATRSQRLCCPATLTSASNRARTRFRSPCAAAKTCTASQLQHPPLACVAPSLLRRRGLVTGLATKCCPPVPPPQLRLSRVSRALHAASVGSPPPVDAFGPSAPSAPASNSPCAAETASNSDDDWDALLDAHGLTPSFWRVAAAVAQPADADKAAKRSTWREI